MSVEEKTPVQVLQEYCQKETKTPQYELVQAEGKDHFPMFFYNLTVGDITISGIQGLSKKKAKHAAAEAMLEKLGVVNPSKEGTTVSKIETAKIPQKNTVGELQQLCTQKEWPAPKYTVTSIEGPSHAPVFIMECTIETLDVAVSGTGRCKKEAKQLVAAQMLQSLAGNPHIQQLTAKAEGPGPAHELQKNDTHLSCNEKEEERSEEEEEERSEEEEEERKKEEEEERKKEEEKERKEEEDKKEEEEE